jgi:hypothetical protein
MVAQTFSPPGHQRRAIGGTALSAPTRNPPGDQYDKLGGISSGSVGGTCLPSIPAPDGVVEPVDVLAAGDNAGIGGDDYNVPPGWYGTREYFRPINCCDWSAMWAQRRWLGRDVERMLASIDYRIEQWPQRFARPEHQYRENASLIAMSEFDAKSLICRCGTIGSSRTKFRPGKCGRWKICPYCSHKKRLEILKKFLPAFKRGRWWFMTISPESLCPLNMLYVDYLVDWWEACRYALVNMIAEGVIQGAFMLETIAISQYWPHAQARPHVHVVLLADELTRATIDRLKELLNLYNGQWWDSRKKKWVEPVVLPKPLWSRASTRTYELKHGYDFASVLSYMCNPVNLAKAYIEDWPKIAGNMAQARLFNEIAVEAMEAWHAAMIERWGHKYFGALQHAHRDFNGVAKKKRVSKSYERALKLNLADSMMKRIVNFDPNGLGEPIEFLGED